MRPDTSITRVLRILVKQDATGDQIVNALLPSYPDTNTNSLKALICRIRRNLPASLAPPRNAPAGWGISSLYTIPDRAALAAFLAGGGLKVGRAA